MTEPAIFTHIARMYDELERRAVFDSNSGDSIRFEGSKVEAFRALGVSQGYYSKIFDSLTEMGCIEQIQRGSGKQDSVILLHRKPEYDEFTGIYERRLTKRSEVDILRQRVSDMNRRLGEFDLNGTFLSLNQRLDKIEARLERIEQGR